MIEEEEEVEEEEEIKNQSYFVKSNPTPPISGKIKKYIIIFKHLFAAYNSPFYFRASLGEFGRENKYG